MALLRRLLRTAGARTLLGIVSIYAIWQVFVTIQAPLKIDDAVASTVDQRGRVDVSVKLGFPPVRYHILVIQDYGRISRTSGETVEVRSVELEDVRELARFYWVDSISPLADADR